MIIHQCEKCGDAAGINGEHWCRTPTAAKLQRDLAAANQQLDAMRAEHKNCAHWKAECETAQAEAERLTVLKEELKRIAIEEVEGIEAERDAMRAERDKALQLLKAEFEGRVQLYQGNPRKSSRVKTHAVSCECVGCYEQTVVDRDQTILALRSELAALRQSTEADAKPGAWAVRDGIKTRHVASTEAFAKLMSSFAPGSCVVPLYERPAPVAPVPGTSEVVANKLRPLFVSADEMDENWQQEGDAPAPPAPARTLINEHWTWRCTGDSTGLSCDTREEAKLEGGGRPVVRVRRYRVK